LTPRFRARGMLSLPAGWQGLILHFDKLSVLSVPKEAALLTPFKIWVLAPPNVSIF